jgi:hypothetical protein
MLLENCMSSQARILKLRKRTRDARLLHLQKSIEGPEKVLFLCFCF